MLTRAQAQLKIRQAAAMVRLSSVARTARTRNLTYLSPAKLRAIESCLESVVRDGIPGDYLEAGVALGGSAIVIASHLDGERRFYGYDVFGLIPEPSDADPPEVHERYAVIASGQSQGIGGEEYYGYHDALYEEVIAAFGSFGIPVDGERVQLHRGLFEDTLKPAGAVAFAHIDCDWHDPLRLCLERIHPHLVPGAWVVIDDYYAYGGARRAVDEFLVAHPDLRPAASRGREHLLLRRAAETPADHSQRQGGSHG